MAELNLTRGMIAVIDDCDFPAFGQHKWYAHQTKAGKFYAARRDCDRQFIYLHRKIIDAPDYALVDHKDLDTMNCRRGNLRVATPSMNNQNANPLHGRKLKGVYRRKNGRIFAAIARVHLGTFDTEEAAAAAYDRAAILMFGEGAWTNERCSRYG